jgi:hypothetical protein
MMLLETRSTMTGGPLRMMRAAEDRGIWWLIAIRRVIIIVGGLLHRGVCVEALAMSVKLHVPLEVSTTLVTRVETGSKVAALDVYYQRCLVGKLGVTDVTDKLLRHHRLASYGSTQTFQHTALVCRSSLHQPIRTQN